MLNVSGVLEKRTGRSSSGEGSLPVPSAVEVGRDWLRSGDVWQRTLAVTGYPREVEPGWLTPLLRAATELDLTLHLTPLPGTVAAERLRRQRARLESSRCVDAEHGRLADPALAAAAQDAESLAGALARGESRLFACGLYLSISARSLPELAARSERVKALCGSLLLHTVPASFRAFDGWLSSLPLGMDRLRLSRTFDTPSIAAAYPFASSDPPLEQGGVLYGLTSSGAPVITDRFSRENFNTVILAYSGAGKSYAAKLEALRLLYQHVQVLVIDPEDEYRRLCEAVGGTHLPLAGEGAVAINPFDLSTQGTGEERALAQRIVFLADLIELLVGRLDGGELAALDRAAHAAYQAAGITSDPTTHSRPAPMLCDLAHCLHEDGHAGRALAERIYPYAHGSLSHLLGRQSTVAPEGHLVCFSLRGLPDRLRPAALMLALDAIWRSLEGPLRRRVVIVDEAWELMRAVPADGREPPGARFLFALAKKARKRWTGLTTITQDPGDLLDSPLGQAVVNNASQQLLLRQSPQAIERVGQAFGLTAAERRHLLTCPTGDGLLITGQAAQRVALHIEASEQEDRLLTTDPAQLAATQHEDAKRDGELSS